MKSFAPVIVVIIAVLVTDATAAERTALVGGRLIDGFGGPPLADSVILIEDDAIIEVGSIATLDVPDGYQVMSTEGMDVLPGLWESHAHLMIVGHADYVHWQTTYAERYADEVMPAAAVQLLLAGVTSARDLGAPLEVSIDIREQIESGDIPGPRLFVSGPFLQHAAKCRPGDQGRNPLSPRRTGGRISPVAAVNHPNRHRQCLLWEAPLVARGGSASSRRLPIIATGGPSHRGSTAASDKPRGNLCGRDLRSRWSDDSKPRLALSAADPLD